MPEFKEIKKIQDVYPQIDEIEHGQLIELQNNIKSMMMDGRIVFQGRDGELLGYEAMYESIFVQNWISQFAINEVNGVRYFDLKGWSEVTDRFTKGVIVVEDETNIPMFIIPSFVRPNLTSEEGGTLAFYAGKAGEAKNVVSEHDKTAIINGLAKRTTEILNKDKNSINNDYTSFVPDWVYHRNGIVPMAMKAMIYIRDNFHTVDDQDLFDKAEGIMKKFYTGQPITDSERNLIKDITHGTFNFDSIVKDGEVAPSKTVPQPQSEEGNNLFDD